MREDQTQLFKMEYETRCDTFGCGENGEYMIGRPDGPLNTSYILCEECKDSIVESVKDLFNMHEKSVHAPKEDEEAVDFELETLEALKTHAQLDDFIELHQLKGIPNREEEGGKLHERKEAIRVAFK